MELDNHDVAILSALANDPRASTVSLSKIVHLSRTAVANRIQKLKDLGAFSGNPATVSFEALGFDVTAFVALKTTAVNSHKQVRNELLALPEVLGISIVTGNELMLLRVVARNMEHLRQFVDGIQRFGSTETIIEFSWHPSPLSISERLARLSGKPIKPRR